MSDYDDKPKRKQTQQSSVLVMSILLLAIVIGIGVFLSIMLSRGQMSDELQATATAVIASNMTLEAHLTETAVASIAVTFYDPMPIDATGTANAYQTRTVIANLSLTDHEPPPTTPFDPTGTAAIHYTQTRIAAMTATIHDAPTLPTRTPSPTMTPTSDFATAAPCAWSWHRETLTDITQAVQNALDEAAIDAEADVYAFGETCGGSGTQGRFAAMETDFDFIIVVDDITDTATMGNIAAGILQIIVNYPPDETPGPNPGRIIFMFSDDDERMNVTVRYDSAVDAMEAGLTGTDLFEALQG